MKGKESLSLGGSCSPARSVKTLEGPAQASRILFWAKVQLSLGLRPVKSFA